MNVLKSAARATKAAGAPPPELTVGITAARRAGVGAGQADRSPPASKGCPVTIGVTPESSLLPAAEGRRSPREGWARFIACLRISALVHPGPSDASLDGSPGGR